jgi:hypothetical protein
MPETPQGRELFPLKTLVNEAQFKKQSFEGKMMGDINTPDANHYLHHLYLDLKITPAPGRQSHRRDLQFRQRASPSPC